MAGTFVVGQFSDEREDLRRITGGCRADFDRHGHALSEVENAILSRRAFDIYWDGFAVQREQAPLPQKPFKGRSDQAFTPLNTNPGITKIRPNSHALHDR
ncbi:hypothetical protein D3C84_640250 [compost metagenome]